MHMPLPYPREIITSPSRGGAWSTKGSNHGADESGRDDGRPAVLHSSGAQERVLKTRMGAGRAAGGRREAGGDGAWGRATAPRLRRDADGAGRPFGGRAARAAARPRRRARAPRRPSPRAAARRWFDGWEIPSSDDVRFRQIPPTMRCETLWMNEGKFVQEDEFF